MSMTRVKSSSIRTCDVMAQILTYNEMNLYTAGGLWYDISLEKMCSPKGGYDQKYEYFIHGVSSTGERVLSCKLSRDIKSCFEPPRSFKWECEQKRYMLYFASRVEAQRFERRVKKAVEDLSSGDSSDSSNQSNANFSIGDDDVFTNSDRMSSGDEESIEAPQCVPNRQRAPQNHYIESAQISAYINNSSNAAAVSTTSNTSSRVPGFSQKRSRVELDIQPEFSSGGTCSTQLSLEQPVQFPDDRFGRSGSSFVEEAEAIYVTWPTNTAANSNQYTNPSVPGPTYLQPTRQPPVLGHSPRSSGRKGSPPTPQRHRITQSLSPSNKKALQTALTKPPQLENMHNIMSPSRVANYYGNQHQNTHSGFGVPTSTAYSRPAKNESIRTPRNFSPGSYSKIKAPTRQVTGKEDYRLMRARLNSRKEEDKKREFSLKQKTFGFYDVPVPKQRRRRGAFSCFRTLVCCVSRSSTSNGPPKHEPAYYSDFSQRRKERCVYCDQLFLPDIMSTKSCPERPAGTDGAHISSSRISDSH